MKNDYEAHPEVFDPLTLKIQIRILLIFTFQTTQAQGWVVQSWVKCEI